MDFQPLHDYVIVKAEESNKNDFITVVADPDEKKSIGIVVAAGPGRFIENNTAAQRQPMTVQKGDKVFFYKGAAEKLQIGDEEYYAMAETNIFFIFKGENKDD